MKDLRDLMAYSLSDYDISMFFRGEINIIAFKNLKEFKSIDDVLGKYERCIILIEGNESNHWVMIQKIRIKNRKPYILFWDSYGLIPENEFNYIPKSFTLMSGQEKGSLIKLLINQPLPVHYSQYRLQQLKDGVNTCGRWCCIKALYPNITEDRFDKLMRATDYTPDELITLLYEDINNE
jgi:hypothetical protein